MSTVRLPVNECATTFQQLMREWYPDATVELLHDGNEHYSLRCDSGQVVAKGARTTFEIPGPLRFTDLYETAKKLNAEWSKEL